MNLHRKPPRRQFTCRMQLPIAAALRKQADDEERSITYIVERALCKELNLDPKQLKKLK